MSVTPMNLKVGEFERMGTKPEHLDEIADVDVEGVQLPYGADRMSLQWIRDRRTAMLHLHTADRNRTVSFELPGNTLDDAFMHIWQLVAGWHRDQLLACIADSLQDIAHSMPKQ